MSTRASQSTVTHFELSKRYSSAGLSRMAAHRLGGPTVAFVGALAGYVVLARLGYELVGSAGGIASFWPPNGWIVALLVLLPRRLRLWVIAAVLPGELIADALQQGIPTLTAVGWGTANSVEAALAAWLLLKVGRRRPLGNTARDFVALAIAAVSAPLAGGLLGAAVSEATYGGSYGTAWLTWWLGDATGIMLVVPLVVSFAWPSQRRTALRRLPGLLELGLVIGAAAAVFAFTTSPLEQSLILPPLVLLAVRRDLRLIAIASMSFAIVATIFTGHGFGPLATVSAVDSRSLGLQAFITTTAFVAFLICATISERKRAETAFAELATRDPLTGLPNRRRFIERFDETGARHKRSSESAAVAYFDLDHFKQINDSLGHAAGDAVLIEVARRLSAAIRTSDLVARIGGDEFAVLLEPVDGIDGANQSARRLVDAVEQPFGYGDRLIPICVSVGTALTGSDSDASLAEADMRLYRDKANRRPALTAVSAG
jgi:diguanylate cyclase (GGDEF)-like protein